MTRILLWAILVAATVAGILAVARIDVFAGLGSPSRVAEFVSFSLGLGGILAFLISARSRFARRIVKAQFRIPWRLPISAKLGGQAGYLSYRQRRLFLRSLAEAITEPGDAGEVANPLASARRLIAARGLDEVRWPWRWRGARQWLKSSIDRTRNAPSTRVFAPELARRIAERAELFDSVLDRFVNLEPIKWNELRQFGSKEELFAQAASRLSGALVLIDAADSRTHRAESVAIWHSDEYRPIIDQLRSAGYGASHGGDAELPCAWNREMRDQRSQSRPSDYDGRTIDMRGVSLVRDTRRGGLHLLIDTAESCYAATEVGRHRCKHLSPGDVGNPVWSAHQEDVRWERVFEPNGRTALLTVSAAVTISSRNGGRSILVMKRAGNLRNGSHVLAIPGGVVTLGFAGLAGDEGVLGLPALEHAIAREFYEEIGIDIAASKWDPVATYLMNQRSADSAQGELVASVMFSASSGLTLDDLRRARATDAHQAGRYESTDLEEIPLVMPSSTARSHTQAARSFAALVRESADQIDQRTFLACIYAASELYGQSEAIDAFDSEMGSRPWPEISWSENWEKASSFGSRALVPRDRLVSQEPPSVGAMETFRSGSNTHAG
jgi:ADP-ribose pyrophosphatase YjhB (NUDIX family)